MDLPDLLPLGGIDPGSAGDYLTPAPNNMVDGVDDKIHSKPAGSPGGSSLHDSNESRFARLTNALLGVQRARGGHRTIDMLPQLECRSVCKVSTCVTRGGR